MPKCQCLSTDIFINSDIWFQMLSLVNCSSSVHIKVHWWMVCSEGGFSFHHSPRFCHMLKISHPIVTRMSPYLKRNENQAWHTASAGKKCVSLWDTLYPSALNGKMFLIKSVWCTCPDASNAYFHINPQ